MKQESGAIGPHSNIGGSELDQAERALFAVYSTLFGFSDYLNKLIEVPEITNKNIKELIKQACLIRKWAQHRKQSLIDENKEIDYIKIAEEIVKKCVVLMNTENHLAFNELGLFKIQNSILPSLRKIQSTETLSEVQKKDSSKWQTVKKTVESMGKIRSLLKLVAPVIASKNEQDEEKKELVKVNSYIFEFLESKINIEALFSEIDNKRNLAVARTIGINYLIHMFKISAKKEKDLKGQIIRVFSDSFRTAESNRKKHYLHNLEGIDLALQNCVQRSFFSMIQLLLNHLSIKEVKDLDSTSQQATHFYLKIFVSTDKSCFLSIFL